MTYKDIIKYELNKNQWELIKIDSLGEWWEEEHWKIQWRHKQGKIIYVQFLKDPMNSSCIWQIRASEDLIYERVNNSEISSLSISKSKFNIKLSQFIEDLETFRKEK